MVDRTILGDDTHVQDVAETIGGILGQSSQKRVGQRVHSELFADRRDPLGAEYSVPPCAVPVRDIVCTRVHTRVTVVVDEIIGESEAGLARQCFLHDYRIIDCSRRSNARKAHAFGPWSRIGIMSVFSDRVSFTPIRRVRTRDGRCC